MNEKTNIIPYNNGGQPASQPKDYSNSNRSKAERGSPSTGGPVSPGKEISLSKPVVGDGFFKATLKEAVDHAVTTVIDPMLRNFVYNTGMSILNTLLWRGKNSTSFPAMSTMMTPYNMISLAPAEPKQPQMTTQDKVWQQYEKLHVSTLEEAHKIMSRLYREFLSKGYATLATYYESFGEKYDFQNEAWGWHSLPKDRMYAQQFADGYHVIMPKLERLL